MDEQIGDLGGWTTPALEMKSRQARTHGRVRSLGCLLSGVIGLALIATVPNPVHAQAPATEAAPALKRMVLGMGSGMLGADRSYSYFISSKIDPHGFNPVVFALRDNNESAEDFARRSGWLRIAEDNGLIVVFPEPAGKDWSPFSGDEDAYLKAVYDHASVHLTIDGPAPQAREQPRPNAAPVAPGIAGDEPVGAFRRPVSNRVSTWQPWQYVVGEGAGAVVAQEFTIDHPGLVAAIATLDGKAHPAAYDRSEGIAQGYFEDQRGGKTAMPSWRPLKKDVPVSAWLFTTGASNTEQARLADYWKRDDAPGQAGVGRVTGPLHTTIYSAAGNPAQQVRLTTVVIPRFDLATTQAVWDDFFSRVARWTDSPNGTLGPMMTRAEVDHEFQLRETKVGDLTYKYYLKTPSSYRPGQSLPLVIALHGGLFPAWMYLSQIRIHEVGEREGFITAYLNAQDNLWNFTIPDSPDMRAIENVIDEVAAQYGADRSRVYLQGFSFGSGMTYVDGLLRPQLFAAISPDSGIGDLTQPVLSAISSMKAQHDIRMPTIVVYGAVDAGGSTDGKIPAQGIIRTAIDFLKDYNHISSPDKAERFESKNADPYDILLPSGLHSVIGRDARYPEGRFNRYDYMSSDPQKLQLFSFVWVTDMPHGSDPAEAQMVWDYFKHWKRNPDGSLQYLAK